MLFSKLKLILLLMMFFYVLAIAQPGCSYKICFHEKGMYPASYGEQTSLPQTMFVIILFFKMQCQEHCLIKTCVKHPCQQAFKGKFQETSTERYSIKKLFWKKLCRSMAFFTTVESMLTAYSKQF